MSENEVVLITGTRRGIGRHLAEHFVCQGKVVVGCSRKSPDWELKNYTHYLVDVSNEKQVRSMFTAIMNQLGRLDIVINNAGIASMNHTLLTPVSTVDRIMAVNFRGTFIVCREAAKIMKKRKYGRIVNIGTVAVPMQIEGEAVYAASKSAVITFSKIFAREVAQFGITCNVVGPSPIKTNLIEGVAEKKIEELISRQGIRRYGEFADVINTIEFFIKPESDFITGQVIYLGGV